jgi:TPR repeat protein
MAKSYYARSADAGLAESQVWLAGWFERQEPPTYGKALRYYKLAADQGNSDGHYGVARLNLDRLLYTPNSQEGLRHLRAAITLNHPEAHYTIARMYGNGSLSGGSVKALEHFQSSANLNFAPAMYELAVAYYQGTPPLKRNATLAAQWWQRAAFAGHLESQYAFSLLYISGNGVERNPGVAFALANLAAAQGHGQAAKVRDQLMTNLAPETLREAQDLSVQLFEKVSAHVDPSTRSLLK